MVAAIIKEMEKAHSSPDIVETIYFGGGTPSLLDNHDIDSMLKTICNKFRIDDHPEITLEANPDDITAQRLSEWRIAGINRLSIGVQSFHDADLLWMNRAHNASQAKQAVVMAKEAGFSVSIDLIYGTPTLSDVNWQKNIDTFISLQIPHLSSYALTVEPATALDKMIRLHKKENVDMDKQATHFLMLTDLMVAAGFEHYEISNFALPGFRSRHNSSYWKGIPYLGFGPSAHSFTGTKRRWNISNNTLYISSIESGKIAFEEEDLSLTQQINERIMISLRTSDGLELEEIENVFSRDHKNKILSAAEKYIADKKVYVDGNRLILTREGKLFADGIAGDLFFHRT